MQSSNLPSVACIVLNWNGWKDTIKCLDALARVDYPNLQVIVVDNCSSDDSVTRIREAHPERLLLTTASNLGFGGGNNVGLRHALEQQFDYIWLLNNDTEPQRDALRHLVQKAGSNIQFGAIGSILRYADSPGTVQAWGGGRVNCLIGHSTHATGPREDTWFDYLTAASMLLPRAALEDVGLFDENFFLYWEDTDLCFRLRSNGWKLGVAASSTVLHKENGSTGGNRRIVDRYSTASGVRFLLKHSSIPWLSIALFISSRIGRRVVEGRFAHIRDVTGGIRDYLRSR